MITTLVGILINIIAFYIIYGRLTKINKKIELNSLHLGVVDNRIINLTARSK